MHALIGRALFYLRVQTRWRHFHLVLGYKDMDDATKAPWLFYKKYEKTLKTE